MRGVFGVALVCGLVGPLSAQNGSGTAERLARLDKYFEQSRAAWRAPAVAVAIVKDDSVVFAKGYGTLEVGRPTRADENTIFAIGSSSKAFTTAALAMLIDEGKLTWDDRAAQYLPGWELGDPWVTREITIRDLVSHRVGLDRADRIWGGTDFTRDDILKRQRHIATMESFRSKFGYNNHMFLAAGKVIENLSGMSWDDFVKRRIFEPLGMARTTTSTKPLAGMTNVATPHAWVGDSVIAIPWHNLDNMAPAGSINSSVREMAEWVRTQLGGGQYRSRRLFSKATAVEMHTPVTPIRPDPWFSSLSPVNHLMVPGSHLMSYGMGWFLQDYRGRLVVSHGGSIAGMRAQVGMVPEERLGFVVLTNLNPSAIDEGLIFRIIDEFVGGGPGTDWARVMLDSSIAVRKRGEQAQTAMLANRVSGTKPALPLGGYAGTYADLAYGPATIEEQEGRLVIRFGTVTGALEHYNYDTFLITWNTPARDKSLATFRLDQRGKAVGLMMAGVPELKRK